MPQTLYTHFTRRDSMGRKEKARTIVLETAEQVEL